MFAWFALMREWGYRCAYCNAHRSEIRDPSRKMDLEIEHVVPMPLGPNSPCNIVPACKCCNSSKSDSDLLDWARWRGLSLSSRVLAVYQSNQPGASNAAG